MKNLDCYQGLKLTNILFYSGLGVMALGGLVIGAAGNWPGVMVASGVIGVVCVIAGLVCGFTYVRCPKCGESLMPGGRVPSELPNFCPHCGKEL